MYVSAFFFLSIHYFVLNGITLAKDASLANLRPQEDASPIMEELFKTYDVHGKQQSLRASGTPPVVGTTPKRVASEKKEKGKEKKKEEEKEQAGNSKR